jgi:hypothetical protein
VLAWRRAALVIDDYRSAYSHDSPTDAIGPTPIEPGALHQRAERAITDVADERCAATGVWAGATEPGSAGAGGSRAAVRPPRQW